MNVVRPPEDLSDDEERQALETLFRFHELWLAERMPDEGRGSVFWQGEKIDYDELKEGLEGQRKYFVSPSPYPGLRSFTPQEGRVFFGRRSDVEEVRDRLKAHRMIMVLGGSGSGKSSLVRAGVLPHLNGVGRIGGRGGTWYWCEFRPEQAPLANLITALATHVVTPLVEAIDARAKASPQLAGGLSALGLKPGATPKAVRAWVAAPFDAATTSEALFEALWDFVEHRLDRLDDLASGGIRAGKPNVLILLDQFEEIFRDDPEEDQQKQTKQLLGLLARLDEKLRAAPWSDGGLFVALTMRSEELHRCGEHDGLTDVVNRSVFLLKLLDPKRPADRRVLHRAIVEPAKRVFISYGIRFAPNDEDSPFAPGVADWLIDGASEQWSGLEHRADQLPLLQHALRSMWDQAVGRWRAEGAGQGGPRLEKRDLPGDDLATDYPDLDQCLSNRADAAAEEARGRFRDYLSDGPPTRLSAEECPEGELALRAAFSALSRQDDREHRARRFAALEEIVPFLENDTAVRDLEALAERLKRALSPLIFHGYLTGGHGRPYDISHEALIRNWEHCSRWLRQNEEVVRALKRFLDDVNPAEVMTLKDKEKIADSVPGTFRAQVALIGQNQPIPESWALDQLELLLRATPERCRVWIGEHRADGLPTRDEVAAVLAKIQSIASNAREARVAIREEYARADEREKYVLELTEKERRALRSAKKAREAEARAREAAREAEESETRAKQLAKDAHGQMRRAQMFAGTAVVAALVTVLAFASSSIGLGVAQRVLATSQIETPPAANWSQAVKLGILKKFRPLPYASWLIGETRDRALQEADRWDRVARSLIGAFFWLDPKPLLAATPARCLAWGPAGWAANEGSADAALTGFASSRFEVNLVGEGPKLLLNIDPKSGHGARQQVDLARQAALPPLGPDSQVCASQDASILTVALRGSAVPKVFELNLLNCEKVCQVALNEVVPNLAPDRTGVPHDKGSLQIVDLKVAKQTQGSGMAAVRSIDTLTKEDDRVAIGFVTDYFTGRETPYTATFYSGWATVKRMAAPAASVREGCGSGTVNPKTREVMWHCPKTATSRGGFVVKRRDPPPPPQDKPSGPGQQAQLVSMSIEMNDPTFRSSDATKPGVVKSRLRVINVAVPAGIIPLGRGPWETFIMKDVAGDLWWVKINEATLEGKIMTLGDRAYLPETVIAAAPRRMHPLTWLFTRRGDK